MAVSLIKAIFQSEDQFFLSFCSRTLLLQNDALTQCVTSTLNKTRNKRDENGSVKMPDICMRFTRDAI